MQVRPDWSAAAADRAARDAASAAVLPPVTVPWPDAGADAGQPLVPATRNDKAAWQSESGQRDWSSSSWGAADSSWGDEQAMLHKARDLLQATEARFEADEEESYEHEEVPEPFDDSVAHSHISADQAQSRPSPLAEAGGDLEPGVRSRGDGGREESEGSGEGGSTDPPADLCGAYTLSGRCTKRACNLVHGAVCPVRGNISFRVPHDCHVKQHAVRHGSAALRTDSMRTYFHACFLKQVRHVRVRCGYEQG